MSITRRGLLKGILGFAVTVPLVRLAIPARWKPLKPGLQRVPLSRITVDMDRSIRSRIDEAHVRALMASIDKEGLFNPITINEDGLLLSGTYRYEACRRLGHKEVACYVPDLSNQSVWANIWDNLVPAAAIGTMLTAPTRAQGDEEGDEIGEPDEDWDEEDEIDEDAIEDLDEDEEDEDE